MQIDLIASHVERMPGHETLYCMRGSVKVDGEGLGWHHEYVPALSLPYYKERIARDIVEHIGLTNKIKELI